MDPCTVDDSVEIPTRCSFVIEFIIPKVYRRLNMFRAAHRSSSGALNCVCSIRFIYPCGDRPLPRLSEKWHISHSAFSSSSGALNCVCSIWFIYPCGDRPLPRPLLLPVAGSSNSVTNTICRRYSCMRSR